MTSSRIIELAIEISKSTTIVHNYLKSNNLPFPTFSPDGTEDLPDALEAARDAIIDATSELHDLLMTPMSSLHMALNTSGVVSTNAILRYNLANSFEPGKEVSFDQIASYAGLQVPIIKRLLRHAMTLRVFCEPRKGVVAHTSRSVLFRDPQIHTFFQNGLEEMVPATLKAVDALQKWPSSEEPGQTGFALANNTDRPIYEVLGDDPARAKRFADTMNVFSSSKGFESSHVISGFDWGSLGEAKVVDVGGSRGHISIALATQFPSLKFKVQDFESTIAGAADGVPEAVSDRVEFEVYNIFDVQKVAADVYFYRWIFHNWSDKYSIKILRSLVPVLRRGVRIIINDICMPEPGTTAAWRERGLRAMDIDMLTILNGRERDLEDWKELLERADPRFHLVNVVQPEKSRLAMIEVSWSA